MWRCLSSRHQQGCTVTPRSVMRKAYRSERRFTVQRDYMRTQADSQKDSETLIDSWYTGNQVISKCRKQGYGWIGELKSNRVVLYEGKSMRMLDLLNILRKGDQFIDTVIDGQIYQTVKVMACITFPERER